MRTKERGITLIALVVTIIVLLILAGISIQMLTGQNGILKRAKEAKDNTEIAEIVENVQREIMEKSMENGGENPSQQDLYDIFSKYFEGVPNVGENVWNSYPEEFPNESGKLKTKKEYGGYDIEVKKLYGGTATNKKIGNPDKNGIFTKNSTIDGAKESYDNPTIPAGFKPVNSEEDSSVGEATWEKVKESVNKGLVIEDSEKNQFVWIPVPVVTKVGATIEEITIDLSDENAETPMSESIDGNYRGILYNYTSMTDELKTISAMAYNNLKYHEPEVLSGKYEDNTYNDADYGITLEGKEGLQEQYNNMVKSVTKYGGFYVSRYEISLSSDGKAQYKKGERVATAATEGTKTWYGLYEKQKNFSKDTNKTSIISNMIWGSQYDAIMNWLAKTGTNVNKPIGDDRNTTGTTGKKETDKFNNIYDLYGNYKVWTMEAVGTTQRPLRAGNPHENVAPWVRNYYLSFPYNLDSASSSRVTLYIL